MKIKDIMRLIDVYGGACTIEEVLKDIQKDKVFKCPKCNGKGVVTISYNAYPPGLPDSGFVEDIRYKDIECDLCKGEGYADKLYKPKMIQQGWE